MHIFWWVFVIVVFIIPCYYFSMKLRNRYLFQKLSKEIFSWREEIHKEHEEHDG